ncbi:MAG: ABC transporter ATP-binding protein [Candidatus Dormibacteraeota bacterium]|uniref:ABC transporter ATP-binding protein n=1 Tax=Candidatus Dormiibacter inghamiae TaxID=3127013 RepID=A0A934KJI4_9BACT|nr:ABC transporter ATP-binding protein [Candidatus Dormibacteraeota bacterium]MBJ7607663.1 ABC transporter ATP-binding protein [Candidatus Dormibacteraeota bacterium]
MTESDRTYDHLLEVRDLHTEFPTRGGRVHAVDGVSFHVDPGETLGIVGESGSGKSVTVLSVMRLLQPPGRIASGHVLYRGRDLASLDNAEMEEIRGADIAMIFQDPMTSFNPVFRSGWQVGEPLRIHRGLHPKEALKEAVGMFVKVGIPEPEKRAVQYPHEMSGGMRQRAMIAMGLTTAPSVLIADEPTTALDVTIQAQILELLQQVSREFGTATILITHNLGVVAGMCQRMMVMYAGRVVEEGPTDEVFAHPTHPYTWSLLRSMPRLDSDSTEPLLAIQGLPPDLTALPSGCAFHPRCPFREERCVQETPALLPVRERQRAACWVTQSGRDLTAGPPPRG